jgi:hypothetical protein
MTQFTDNKRRFTLQLINQLTNQLIPAACSFSKLMLRCSEVF